MSTPAKELLIGVLLYDGVMTLDWVGPASYLELLPTLGVPVKFVTISNKQGRIQDDTKVTLHALTHYSQAPEKLDLFVVPGGRGCTEVMMDEPFMEYFKKAAESATFVLSVCTGSYLLAAVGLLDGKRATTNKLAFDIISSEYPSVNWIRRARWVVDGKFWTGSGVAAGLDMAHAFVSEHYGAKAATEMARYMEIIPNTDPNDDPFENSSATPLAFQ